MSRKALFLIMASVATASMAGAAIAQTNDPLAAAPVQYDGGPSTQMASTPIDCGLDDGGRPLACPNDTGYTPDDQFAPADDAPLFAPDYYAYQDYAYYPPYPYYAGVSLWPSYYWPGYAWGWGGWGLGWGWPYISVGFGWGWGGHGWWNHGYAWHGGGWGDHYHGPWRYDGHGHYADNARDFGRGGHDRGFADRSRSGFASSNFAGGGRGNFGVNRSFTAQRGMTQNTNGAGAFARGSAFGNQARGAQFGANRGSLASSSYYANAHGTTGTQSFNRGAMNSANRTSGFSSTTRGESFANRGYGINGQNARVASMPNRSYGAPSYRAAGTVNRSYGVSMQRGGFNVPQQRYGSPSRSYGGYATSMHGSQSYSRPTYAGRSYSSQHVSSAPSHSSGGGGRSSGNSSNHHH